jgi:aconitate hydratase
LTFVDPTDYAKIMEDDRISIIGLNNIKPKESINCVLHHIDGRDEEISLLHSYNQSQLDWFRAGSALNMLHSIETN